ncbi:hypothetical protein BDR05DRAFT_952706 [Suillus weaverae]|nr:hypothetical protein BDR05DRAFT_952706 [Suillus weaverae]
MEDPMQLIEYLTMKDIISEAGPDLLSKTDKHRRADLLAAVEKSSVLQDVVRRAYRHKKDRQMEGRQTRLKKSRLNDEVVEKNTNEDSEFFRNPDEEVKKKALASFIDHTGNTHSLQSSCVSCAREKFVDDLEGIYINQIPNPHLLTPVFRHHAQSLVHGMLLYIPAIIKAYNQQWGPICSDCLQDLHAKKIPLYSLANGLWIGDIPDELAILNLPELYVIKLYPQRKDGLPSELFTIIKHSDQEHLEQEREGYMIGDDDTDDEHNEIVAQAKWTMQYSDRHFRKDFHFMFQVFGVIQKCEKHLSAVRAKVMGTDESRINICLYIWGMTIMKNPPSLWITINPTDTHDPIAQVFAGEDIDLDNLNCNLGPDSSHRATIIANDPYAAAIFFHFIIQAILEELMGISVSKSKNGHIMRHKGIFGTVEGYIGTVEAQGRGTLHLHMLVWLQGAPTAVVMKNRLQSPEFRTKVANYIGANIHAHHAQNENLFVQYKFTSVVEDA